ncbi:MAG: hypothetical protein Kow0042_29410 [Calditrichia bacterium]
MKSFRLLFLLILLVLCFLLPAATLQSVYQNAASGLGYDKLMILESDSVYTGGISINNQKVAIKGRGALIDLAGDRIFVQGQSVLDMDGCVVINGADGILYQDQSSGLVTQSTFYGNQIGIRFESTGGYLEVYNTILAYNTLYGFASIEGISHILHYINAFQNYQGDYVEWCPS